MLLRAKIKNQKRGILLPLSCLPSNYGIGSLGKEAYRFIDFLKDTKQSYWQILPLCPVGRGNSPYAAISSFAGEILYIDIDVLKKEGLLKSSNTGAVSFSKNVNYDAVRDYKIPLLRLAASKFDKRNIDFKEFCDDNSYWLNDFALFMSIREVCGYNFLTWEEGLKYREKKAVDEFKYTHQQQIDFYKITQYLFYKQYQNLHSYALSQGVEIIGDIPFYVDVISADVWANPEVFKLGKDLTPTLVAGVPPDIFSSTGQLWGNPIYNWSHLKATNYRWWEERLVHNAKLYDVIRIDHFRAFADYYCISAGSKDATAGYWEKGVGNHFWSSVKEKLKNTKIIAEDLGGEDSPLVMELLRQTGFPNMKVLQFAFDSDLSDPFLPKNYTSHCVCYTGTHDNDTTLGWYQKATEREKEMFDRLVPKKYESPVLNLISFALKSKAGTVIIPLVDYMELDSEHRINVPSTPKGNWEWRLEKDYLSEELKQKMKI